MDAHAYYRKDGFLIDQRVEKIVVRRIWSGFVQKS